VQTLTDPQLLRAYAEDHSEAAFGELVRRHVDLTYSVALRIVRDTHLAEDVTQAVFVALAQNAGTLSDQDIADLAAYFSSNQSKLGDLSQH